MSSPLVTIGMPVFNDIAFIEKSLKSILNQTEKRFVLLISDDGATDGSAELCLNYAEMDSRITYLRQPKNLGISKNMEFLLSQAKTPFFMWAADDDLWDPNFIKSHITSLEKFQDAIVSFGKYSLIDEEDIVHKQIDVNYSSSFKILQLLKLIWFEDDGFGYGVFRTSKIKSVKFPNWWWPNKKTPYNNIFPSLCYYLNNGKYLHNNQILFYKRVKVGKNINHKIGGAGNGFFEIFSFYLRRLYLVIFSTLQAFKSMFFWNAIIAFPFMLFKWFFVSNIKTTLLSIINKVRNWD
jgi:glycosyltransferase involved in cell wall biosynthesis